MKLTLESYRDERDRFLAKLTEFLSRDERFVAGWLTGSFSRDEADFLSDIDLSLVVSEAYSPELCMWLDQVSPQTSPERYSLFSQFGEPALIHENKNNAPEGGTFTFVLYATSAMMVDWILIPRLKARRPYSSKPLFDKVGIPVLPPSEPKSLEQRINAVVEMWAFFWMTAVTIKYVIRNDGVFAAQWLEKLSSLCNEIERQLHGEPWKYTRGSLSQLQTSTQSQGAALIKLCERMQGLRPEVAKFIGSEPQTPTSEIEQLFSLVNE
jgi:hypothetical protein